MKHHYLFAGPGFFETAPRPGSITEGAYTSGIHPLASVGPPGRIRPHGPTSQRNQVGDHQ
jgi:hypothetical protein